MKITKRRVTKRNRIKRKYSKKRTKTRHSRKRVFSKKRRKTIKKKKRGGGGNGKPLQTLGKRKKTTASVFNFDDGKSSSDGSQEIGPGWMHDSIAKVAAEKEAEEKNSRKKIKNEKSPVLLITTHGAVTSKTFVLPFEIKKLNATPFGCVNYLESGEAHNLGEQILGSTKNTSSDDELATEIKRHMDIITNSNIKYLKEKYIRDDDANRFLNLPPEGHNKIHSLKKNKRILNTELFTYNKQSLDKNPTPYFNSIMLLEENHPQIDVFREILPRRAPRLNEDGTNVLMLSDVLNFLNSEEFKEEFNIEISSLIIVDLSCSSIDSVDQRFIRKLVNNNRKNDFEKPHGGNYNYKKKDNKKKNK